jgi:hypothetical protein
MNNITGNKKRAIAALRHWWLAQSKQYTLTAVPGGISWQIIELLTLR